MYHRLLFSLVLLNLAGTALAQRNYAPKIEPCDCRFKIDSNVVKTAPGLLRQDLATPMGKIDSSFQTQCGYLVVPENRAKKNARLIRLPFVVLKSKNPDKRPDPLLFTGGGPGSSSIDWAIGATRDNVLKDRDWIVLEQRGTRYAWPYLRNFELDEAIRESYRKNLDKDSMMIVGVKRSKKALESRGIDLSGYNTGESVADISDLLTVLKLDSVNLHGVSYSGTLMMAVAQQDPRVRSLVLDSPLPAFARIDEEEPYNFMKALDVYFDHVRKDSSDQRYADLKQKFQAYFTGITKAVFTIPYLEKGRRDSLRVQYTKNDLLFAILDQLQNDSRRKNLAFTITDIIAGNHLPYVKPRLDALFDRNNSPSGMRISVYCSDQASYHNETILHQLYQIYPYLAGFHINDVYKAMCDCWKVPPVNPVTKQHYYSMKPVLVADGEMDGACSPAYLDLIHQRMPNTQRFLFINRAHGVGGRDWNDLMRRFLNNPFQKLSSGKAEIIGY